MKQKAALSAIPLYSQITVVIVNVVIKVSIPVVAAGVHLNSKSRIQPFRNGKIKNACKNPVTKVFAPEAPP